MDRQPVKRERRATIIALLLIAAILVAAFFAYRANRYVGPIATL